MRFKKIFSKKNIGIWGLIGTSANLVLILLSVTTYVGRNGEPYSLLNHQLSELTEHGLSELSALLCNMGLVIGGLMLVPFFIGIGLLISNKLAKLGIGIGVYSSIMLTALGFFSFSDDSFKLMIHQGVSIFFFMGMSIAVLVFTVAILVHKQESVNKLLAVPGIIMTIVSGIFQINFALTININRLLNIHLIRPDFWAVAIMEWIVYFLFIGWIMITSASLLLEKKK